MTTSRLLLESNNRDVVIGGGRALAAVKARSALPSLVKLLERSEIGRASCGSSDLDDDVAIAAREQQSRRRHRCRARAGGGEGALGVAFARQAARAIGDRKSVVWLFRSR